jgi:DNA-binding transcriptional regulator LsrR (DeoR family)
MDLGRRLVTQVCHLYYEQNLTQQEIGRLTGLSRMKISRLLQKAKDSGLVKITIDYSGSFVELENQLAARYGLKNVIIVDSALGGARANVAAAAAFFLENNLAEGSTIAVGWGSTLAMIPAHLHKMPHKKLCFSPIIGGHGTNEIDMHASTIASALARRSDCQSMALLSPAFTQTVREKEVLLANRFVSEVLSRSASAEYALFSLGNPLGKNSSLAKTGYFSDAEIKLLQREKAVCDMVSILFLNDRGQPCCDTITMRSIGIKADELKKIPTKICVVEGEEKHLSVRIALDSHFIDVLILDNVMASCLLEK